MNAPKIYQADLDFVWDGDTSLVARADPMNEGEWLIPGRCVLATPLEAGPHQANRLVGGTWTSQNQGWELVPDYVGYVYWTEDGTRHCIKELGVEPPEGHLTQKPAEPLPAQKSRLLLDVDARIEEVEGTADRALRELVAPTSPSYARMQRVEAAVAPLRTKRSAVVAATTQEALDAAASLPEAP